MREEHHLEYNVFKIPKPDLTFILKVPANIGKSLSQKLAKTLRRATKATYLGKKTDIHEKDINHLTNTEKSYLHWIEEFPKDFKVIECFQNQSLLSAEEISQKIWEITKKNLK